MFIDSYKTGNTRREGCAQDNDALRALDAGDPTSAIGRFEDRIRREEATVRGQQELAASSLDAQFASLEVLGEQTEVEARLAALKSMDRKAIDYWSPAADGSGPPSDRGLAESLREPLRRRVRHSACGTRMFDQGWSNPLLGADLPAWIAS